MKKTNVNIIQVLCKMTTAQKLVDKFIEKLSDFQVNAVNLQNNELTVVTSTGTSKYSDSNMTIDSAKEFISAFQEAAGIKKKSKWQTVHFKDAIVDIDIYEEVITQGSTIPAKISFEVKRK